MSNEKLFQKKLSTRLAAYINIQKAYSVVPEKHRTFFHIVIDKIVDDLTELRRLDAERKNKI